jgi:hypothetical protein
VSYTTAYLIQSDGATTEIGEFRNSHGFGPFVWSAVSEKYLGKEHGWLLDDAAKLWPLWKDKRLPRHWRAALLVTYDYAIVEKERFRDIAECLRKFVMDVGLRDRACHFPEISILLDKHAADAVLGMCFHGTSITENVWHPWDHDKDEPLKYDLAAPGKHFFVGASLDESESPAPPKDPPAP